MAHGGSNILTQIGATRPPKSRQQNHDMLATVTMDTARFQKQTVSDPPNAIQCLSSSPIQSIVKNKTTKKTNNKNCEYKTEYKALAGRTQGSCKLVLTNRD